MRRTTAAWLLAALTGLLLASCSDQHTAIGIPHPVGRALLDRDSPTFHGNAQTLLSLNCADCHDVGDKCYQCHFGPDGKRVPAGVAYTHGVIPHNLDALKAVGAVCDRCHDLTKTFRGQPASCHHCHEGQPVPHPLGRDWIVKSANFHGNNTTFDCAACHDKTTFCSSCHFGPTGSRVPADVTGWTHDAARTGHAAANRFTGPQEMVCITCHTQMKSFGLGPQFTDCSVSGCHGFTYHGTGFFDQHPGAAHADLSTCRTCHDAPTLPPNFSGYVTGVACATCHTDALAHPPPPATTPEWYVSHRTAGGTRAAACGICHSVDVPGAGPLPGAPSCFSSDFKSRACHAGGPGTAPHPLGQAWLDPRVATFHGKNTTFDCSACHDEATFCSKCHFGPSGSRVPPGVTGWTHDAARRGHAAANRFTSQQTAVCVACHELTKSFNIGPASTDCSTATCHGLNYHGTGFFAQHSAAAHNDLSTCRTCHDTPGGAPNFDGYVTGVACAACHTAALAHPPPPAGSSDWYVSHRTAGGTRAAACGICHKIDGPGVGPLAGAPSCFSASFGSRGCHSQGPGSAPHPLGQAWLDPSQATFHGTNLNLFPCQDCHDPNTFCFQCHFGPTGSRVPPNVTWTHGRYPHDLSDLVSQQAVCNQCHTLMQGFSGHPARTDCANCHGIVRPHGIPFQAAHQTQSGMDLAFCQRCHGEAGTTQFAGGVEPQPVCSTCHTDARAHPVPWRLAAGATVSHKDAGNLPTACSICHDVLIVGTGTTALPGAPPCRSCHPTGFVPHAVPFKAANLHGGPAKGNLNICQSCHSDNPMGGPGSNPRFNVPITAINGSGLTNGCEDCHTPGSAHATNWQGQDGNMLSHRSAGHLPDACNICHGAALQGATAAGVVRPSCSSASFTNAATATTACHSNGYLNLRPFHPAQASWLPTHSGLANVTCTAECHAANGTTTVNGIPGCGVCHFGPSGSRVPAGVTWTHGAIPHDFLVPYAAVCNKCHVLTNSFPNITCSATCHAVPHAVPFKAASLHGAPAKADLTVCQACHSDNPTGGPGSNPRFNVPITPINGTGLTRGCEDCHNDSAAHPARAGRDNYQWFDRTYTHRDAGNLSTACARCHGATFQGGAGPACTTCHVVSPVTNPTGCVSCHNSPPNGGAPAGNVRPNRAGRHTDPGEHRIACSNCHSGVGSGTTTHFDTTAPAVVQFAAGISITITQSGGQATCNGDCHGEGHSNRQWY